MGRNKTNNVFEKGLAAGVALIFLAVIAYIAIVSAVGEVSYCCEKTVNNAWCQNAPQDKCDSSYRKVPTSCEATSYCKLGTCIDSQEGTCMENTPQKVCEDSGGVWNEGKMDEIPQCSLGCCLIGDQAAFVTQTRCKRLSSLYGLETDFRTNIGSEIECIASATSDVKGACVFEDPEEMARTCKFITKRECRKMEASSPDSNVEFYEGLLCSAEELATNCGPSERTTCIEGRDEVFFVDSCGNPANIYDASKIKDKNYWTKAYGKEKSCGFSSADGNAGSSGCGNCDYFLGSTCKSYERGKDRVKPTYGDNICRDLSCNYLGKKYKHGETWCADASGTDKSLPGSRHFRLVCYNGEVSIEPCADFRQEVCVQDDIDGFKTAACRVNKWQDCSSQTTKKDCENKDRRDCKWSSIGCVPENAPGFNFWEEDTEAESLCSIADTQCTVVFEKGLTGKEKCVKNCECLSESWKKEMNNACISLGDCGGSTNFIGVEGYNS